MQFDPMINQIININIFNFIINSQYAKYSFENILIYFY